MPRKTVWAPNITTGEPFEAEIDTDRPPIPHGPTETLVSAIVGLLRPSVAVEIGVMHGGTIVCIAHNMPPGGVVYGLDLKPECARPLVEAWGMQDRVVLIGGDSRHTVDQLPQGIGFAYIDGNHDHSYAASDGRAVWDRLLPGGVIVFDDVNDPANDGIPGPARAVIDLFGEAAPLWLHGGRGCAVVHKPGGRMPIRLIDA